MDSTSAVSFKGTRRLGKLKHNLSGRARLVAPASRRGGVSAERRKPWREFKWRLFAESRYAEGGGDVPHSNRSSRREMGHYSAGDF
jgi:hypothetical protein